MRRESAAREASFQLFECFLIFSLGKFDVSRLSADTKVVYCLTDWLLCLSIVVL